MKIAHKLLWFLRSLGFLIQAVLGVSIACMVSLLIVSQSSSPKAPAPISLRPASPPESSNKEEVKSVAVHSLPVRLKIPKLNVDANIERLGVTPEGDMQSPASPKNAGWYKLGPNPGNEGSAVIAGHYGSGRFRGQSVFDNLHTLSKGDSISVEDETGAIATFTIQESQIYGRNEIVPEVFNSSDGKAHLNLVTCQGKWIAAEGTYENRLVVFTDKVN